MLNVQLDEDQGIAILEPDGELSKEDFETASRLIDPYIEEHDALNGIMIHVRTFPGWDSFSSLVAHLKFVKEHHQKVARIAFATDSPIGGIAAKIAPHFVNAEIKRFAFDEFEAARTWIVGGT
ncbi:hypothetical protein Mal15_63560 [Stieleria maiorica]|uniref:STAS/SEC14 domain-containing protein n=1 Tax=Stieleria maiorica TaxID=2795974 RepID=A0A5B9MPH5_9BACT|nr:STAS/SEC14 domain-containing protein [Stieleria maiorica]QEG02270.1 hypothetical protein Mal15_63560 [Stieleria maiorica]